MKRWVDVADMLFSGLLLLTMLVGSCTLHLAAPYDARTEEQIRRGARGVERFYAQLQERPEERRPYGDFAPRYREIEAELRNLVLRNSHRSLNEDSTQISRKILEQWQRCRERHLASDAYRTARADRDRDGFRRLFEYAARAEESRPHNH